MPFSPQPSEPNSHKGRILVVIAEFLSPGAKQLLEAEHIGYYESGGSLYLPRLAPTFT